jgi:hypothetical protein
MATGTAGTTARSIRMPVTQHLAFTLAFGNAAAPTGILIGTLPSNAVIQSWRAIVTTAFNAATTNPITIGTTATGSEVAAAASITSGTAGVYTGSPAAAAGWAPMATDKPIYVAYIPTGTAATTGSAVIFISYVNLDDC